MCVSSRWITGSSQHQEIVSDWGSYSRFQIWKELHSFEANFHLCISKKLIRVNSLSVHYQNPGKHFKANIEKEPIYPLHTGQRTLSKPQKINAFGTQSSCPYGQRVNACGSFYSEKSSIDGLDWSFLSDWGLRPELAVDSGEQKVGRSLSSWKNKSCSTKMLGKYVRE